MAEQKKYVSLSKLGLYDEKIKAHLASADTTVLNQAKAYADGLADNYEAAGVVATAKTALETEISTVEAKADAAQAAADAAQSDVDVLESLVGSLPDGAIASTVVDYIDEKTTGIATDGAVTSLTNRVTAAENAIDAIEADYLKAEDKTELSDAIEAEAARADAAEKVNAAAIDAIEADYLKAEDKTTLETSIAAAKKAGDDAQADIDAFMAAAEVGDAAVDTLKEIQEYITSDGAAAATMTSNISANADAIEALDEKVGAIPTEGVTATNVVDYAKEIVAAEKTRAESAEADLDGRLDIIEAKFDSGEGSVADQIADAKQEAIDSAIAAASTDATTKAGKALDDAKAYADAEDAKIETRVATLETASATHAAASDLAALAARVTTAESEIDTLQTDVDAVEALAAANKLAHEANASAITLKASQSDLDAAVVRIAANETAIAAFVEVSESEINELFA